MILTLAVVATGGAPPAPFLAALEIEKALTNPAVRVVIAQDASRPFGDALHGAELITAPPDVSIFRLWGLALSVATTPHVAFLDARCPIDPGWLETVLVALSKGDATLFGPVRCGWPARSEHILGYLVEYLQFNPPLTESLRERPGVNFISTRMTASDPAVLVAGEFMKTRLLALLDARGARVRPVAGATVTYRKAFGFSRYLQHRFDHGRCYGANRTFPIPGARLLALAATPALPMVRTWRIFRAARTVGMRSACWRWLHRILIAETFWSAGEAWGYLSGEGDARRRLI